MTAVQSKPEIVGNKRLEGKVALVTGGSRGIGAAIALRLAQEGARVAISYSSNQKAADEVLSQINKFGNSPALAIKANVSSEQETQKLIEELSKQVGKIDILVNNAGVWDTAPVDQITLEHYNRVFDVNIKGVISTTVAALKKMNDGGRIINISSGLAQHTMPGTSVYSATKSALETLTRVWAQELGGRQITVNAVAPGTTATDMLLAALPEEMKKMMIAKTALGRLGEGDDIAAAVAFLASDDGRWVTGHTISANGGLNV